MIRISVMYPNDEARRFDMDYYSNKHMPMVIEKLGSACKCVTIDKGVGGGEPGSPAPYIVMCHLQFESLQEYQSSFGPHAQMFADDVANYTDMTAVVQVSEVVM